MTTQQKELVKAVKVYYKKHGYPCTQRYLARLFNVTPSTMTDRTKALINKGLLRRTENGQIYPQIDVA